MIELYEFALSGNCHKIRMMLPLLGLRYQSIAVNGQAREHKSEQFLALNPYGQVPVLKDGDTIIRDSQAILVYLARRYGDERWLPVEATALAHVVSWLSIAANEVARGPNALRLHHKFGRAINLEEARQITTGLLSILQSHLEHHQWLAAEHATVADIAAYPYIALAPEGDIDIELYPAVTGWLARIQALAGYVEMPGMWVRKIPSEAADL